jgi:hypothetical protein
MSSGWLQRFRDTMTAPDRLLLVAADHDGEVVGYLSAVVADGSAMRPVKMATLLSLYVQSGSMSATASHLSRRL